MKPKTKWSMRQAAIMFSAAILTFSGPAFASEGKYYIIYHILCRSGGV